MVESLFNEMVTKECNRYLNRIKQIRRERFNPQFGQGKHYGSNKVVGKLARKK